MTYFMSKLPQFLVAEGTPNCWVAPKHLNAERGVANAGPVPHEAIAIYCGLTNPRFTFENESVGVMTIFERERRYAQ